MSNRTVLMTVFLSEPGDIIQTHALAPNAIQLNLSNPSSPKKGSAFTPLMRVDAAAAAAKLRAFADHIDATVAADVAAAEAKAAAAAAKAATPTGPTGPTGAPGSYGGTGLVGNTGPQGLAAPATAPAEEVKQDKPEDRPDAKDKVEEGKAPEPAHLGSRGDTGGVVL
jgi:hypothetical protein